MRRPKDIRGVLIVAAKIIKGPPTESELACIAPAFGFYDEGIEAGIAANLKYRKMGLAAAAARLMQPTNSPCALPKSRATLFRANVLLIESYDKERAVSRT